MEFKYDWKDNKEVCDLLVNLYYNTYDYLQSVGYDLKYAEEFIHDIEDYLFYIKHSFYHLDRAVAKLSSIKFIGFFDAEDFISSKKNSDVLVPPMIYSDDAIYLNDNMQGNERLTGRERMRLYLYSGLTHKIVSLQNEKTLEFSKIKSDNIFDFKQRKIELVVNNGWFLLENVIAQEMAEHITYKTLGKYRPEATPGLEGEVYPIDFYYVYSDLEMYRMFSEILVSFGFAISRIGELTSHSRFRIINDFTVRAMNEDFSDAIISEFVSNGEEFVLYDLLYLFGLLVNEKDATYGMDSIHNLRLTCDDTETILMSISKILSRYFNLDDKKYQDVPVPKRARYLGRRRGSDLYKYEDL